MELTVLIPCLNEAETIEKCIIKARRCMESNGIDGEVLVADNGSTDGSIEIATSAGARVIHVNERGYGAALIGGTIEAKGEFCIMGDADDSYDFEDLMPYVEKLRCGYDLVMGNRFKGGIEKGAMPFLHRYLGTPVISFLGRMFYHNSVYDFNCGMRGYNTQMIRNLNLISTGMEYASEMIVKASLHNYSIAEVPTTLKVDGRSRKPYLNTWGDGWRHLKLLLIYSPNWLFFIPSLVLIFIGLVMVLRISFGPIRIGNVSLSINTMLFGASMVIAGMNTAFFGCFSKAYAAQTGYIPITKSIKWMNRIIVERGIGIGILFVILGISLAVASTIIWGKNEFGDLEPTAIMRMTIPAVTFFILGVEMLFGGFMIEILRTGHK